MTLNSMRKAAVNTPQSKRSAKFKGPRQSRQRLDCGGFSAAFVSDNVNALAFPP
jgi:hypothetical protein